MSMQDAYVYDGLRTPIGRHAGGLAPVRPDDLLSGVIKAVVARNPFKPGDYEDAVVGCTNQAGEDARNVARHAALLAGLPTAIGGLTVNRLCGSGLAAIADAARAASCGQGALFIAGGVESMSRAPFVMAKAESAYSREMKLFDSTIGARFPNPRIAKSFGDDTMPQTADNVAHDHAISREDSDRFALASQEKYARAKAAGFYDSELMPVSVPGAKKGSETVIAQDEHPRPNTTMDRLAELKPLFANGVVTAGNASGINDGAAAVVLMTGKDAQARGLKPLARIVSWAQAGVDPAVMGSGPIPASRAALKRAGWTPADLDLVEANEAFAAQACAVNKDMGWDTSKVNVNGGAIAIGHPIGASGARVLVTLLHEMQKRDAKKGLATLCIGGGMGIAMCVER
jgi:acetyl-CoA C-acetyltransferase